MKSSKGGERGRGRGRERERERESQMDRGDVARRIADVCVERTQREHSSARGESKRGEERKRRTRERERESRVGYPTKHATNAADPLDVSIKTPTDSAAVSSSSRSARETRISTWKIHDLEDSYVVAWNRFEERRLSYVRRALEAHPPLIGSRTITRACNVNTDFHKSRKFRGGRPVVIPGANWKF